QCQGAKALAIRYELGLLYEAQEQWSQAAAIYESIPTFHDVPKRLELARAHEATGEPTTAFRYGNSQDAEKARQRRSLLESILNVAKRLRLRCFHRVRPCWTSF